MTNDTLTYLSLFLTTIPIIGALFNFLLRKTPKLGAKLATIMVSLGLILSCCLLVYSYANKTSVDVIGFETDELGILMTTLIFFVSTVVHQFSIRYMSGDSNYKSYFYKLSLITSSASIMAVSDHIVVFFLAWCVSNYLLISLMTHKQNWGAAVASGKLAFTTLFSGAILLIIALSLMYVDSGSMLISTIIEQPQHSPLMLAALILCVITAMTQSALWPFHKWLISSLNSPTPVSAIMHAGLVNGGGFLLVRFSPMVLEHQGLLNLIFILGVITAVIGTLWKLVQSDIKRMLACSTMGQMGFMMIQCGLGLFPAAIAHLVWHGLFKAFLFLSAGSAVQSKKIDTKTRDNSLTALILSCSYGLLGAYCFALFSNKTFFSMHTTTFLVGFAFIAATQVAHALLQHQPTFFKNLLAILGAALSGTIYGCSIHLIEGAIPSIAMANHQINALHFTAFMGFLSIWLVLNLDCLRFVQKTNFWKRSYLAILNSSQPHPKTITSIRQSYQY